MLNYVSQPTVEVIQVLLIISNVLSYNMNAGASYTLLGRLPPSLPNTGIIVYPFLTLANQVVDRHDGENVPGARPARRIKWVHDRGSSHPKTHMVSVSLPLRT